jgi:hypothetical protein
VHPAAVHRTVCARGPVTVEATSRTFLPGATIALPAGSVVLQAATGSTRYVVTPGRRGMCAASPPGHVTFVQLKDARWTTITLSPTGGYSSVEYATSSP